MRVNFTMQYFWQHVSIYYIKNYWILKLSYLSNNWNYEYVKHFKNNINYMLRAKPFPN